MPQAMPPIQLMSQQQFDTLSEDEQQNYLNMVM